MKNDRTPIVHCIECEKPITASVYTNPDTKEDTLVPNALKCVQGGYICFGCIDKKREDEDEE